MNTLNREQIDQLERLLEQPVPPPRAKSSDSNERLLFWLKIGYTSMALIAIACLLPNLFIGTQIHDPTFVTGSNPVGKVRVDVFPIIKELAGLTSIGTLLWSAILIVFWFVRRRN